MKEVGKRLKALRDSIGFSQVKMADFAFCFMHTS